MVGGLLAAALAQPQLQARSSVQHQTHNRTQTHSQQAAVSAPPLRIAVIDTAEPKPFDVGTNPPYDLRVSALSIASRRMLEAVGAWKGIEARRVCPYRNLSVWDGEAHGRTDFRASDCGAAELGYIVENRVLQLALWEQLQSLPSVQCLCPATVEAIEVSESGVELKLSGSTQTRLTAKLLVGADGARSMVRQQAGINVDARPYDQHALVANVTTALPQQQITWQRFVPTGPQAMLPLCGDRASLVWYHTEDEVARLKELDEQTFIKELQAAFPEELGGIESVQARASFPIARAHAERYVAQRVALCGDAAHTVHPLAGQGVNLGLLDAAALAEVLIKAHHAGRDPGAAQVLARYERWRRLNNSIMIESLDAIHKAFSPQPIWFQKLRSVGLNTVANVKPLRNRVMQHAMGTQGDLPRLARP